MFSLFTKPMLFAVLSILKNIMIRNFLEIESENYTAHKPTWLLTRPFYAT